ncbi:MAG TPA: TIM-barrel domain-containing protein [Candidatus Obscuribacterales bacterium]
MAKDQEGYWKKARMRGSGKSTQVIEQPGREFACFAQYHTASVSGVATVRVSVSTEKACPPPSSYALDIGDDQSCAELNFAEGNAAEEAGVVRLEDFRSGTASRVEWQEESGEPPLPLEMSFKRLSESRFQFSFRLREGTRCLGLGERYGGLNRRGAVHTLFNTDDPHHYPSIDQMYKSIPFLIIWYQGRCHGIFIDSPARQKWNLDSDMTGLATVDLISRRGFQMYIMGESSLPQIVGAYTQLTGKAKLPPLWSLGHQQCRWSYPDEPTVREIASEFRQRHIPCDTIVLDIDYMEDYRVFTTSSERFPDFKKLVADLYDNNFRVVTIVDPGVKKDAQYSVFQDGKKHGYFVKKADGKLFIAEVWPGESAFPDFLREDVRRWWAAQHGFLTDQGVSGIWTDMNEPAFFDLPKLLLEDGVELPPDEDQLFMQQTPEGAVGHFEVRNLYGFQMARATHEGLKALRPNERPFVLSRSAYAGIQRYAAVWLGDNSSWWEHLARSMPMLVSMGLSGVAFSGVDIGGFSSHCTGELLARWYALGLFYPLFRNHCWLHGRVQEPWAYTPAVEAACKKFIETRYRLLPYLQGLFLEHQRSGAPVMRPLAYHYADDEHAAEIDDQFLFGKDILVAPIVERGRMSRAVYLPSGRWHRFDGRETLEGGRAHQLSFAFDEVPAFVRDGAIIPLADVVESTAEYHQAAVTFAVYGCQAEGSYYEDDGISFDYEFGCFNEWQLTYKNGKFESKPTHMGFGAPSREFRLRIGEREMSVRLRCSS